MNEERENLIRTVGEKFRGVYLNGEPIIMQDGFIDQHSRPAHKAQWSPHSGVFPASLKNVMHLMGRAGVSLFVGVRDDKGDVYEVIDLTNMDHDCSQVEFEYLGQMTSKQIKKCLDRWRKEYLREDSSDTLVISDHPLHA